MQREHHQLLQRHRQLEVQYGETLAANQQLRQALQHEQQRSQELAQGLAEARSQLEEAVGRLARVTQQWRELSSNLITRDQQIDQLQGELAVTLQQTRPDGGSPGPIQLNRIIVGAGESSALQGRVVSVHTDWHFVVVNLGWNAVKIGDTVSIFRDQQLIAKARIERVQEGVSAATLLPDWERVDVHVNDLVKVL